MNSSSSRLTPLLITVTTTESSGAYSSRHTEVTAAATTLSLALRGPSTASDQAKIVTPYSTAVTSAAKPVATPKLVRTRPMTIAAASVIHGARRGSEPWVSGRSDNAASRSVVVDGFISWLRRSRAAG